MTDLNISYEDGLRLSELCGQLASQEFHLDNFMTIQTPYIIGITMLLTFLVITLVIIIAICYPSDGCESEEEYRRKRKIILFVGIPIAAASSIVIYMLLCKFCMTFEILGLEQSIEGTRGQIGALLAKYNMTWDDIAMNLEQKLI